MPIIIQILFDKFGFVMLDTLNQDNKNFIVVLNSNFKIVYVNNYFDYLNSNYKSKIFDTFIYSFIQSQEKLETIIDGINLNKEFRSFKAPFIINHTIFYGLLDIGIFQNKFIYLNIIVIPEEKYNNSIEEESINYI